MMGEDKREGYGSKLPGCQRDQARCYNVLYIGIRIDQL